MNTRTNRPAISVIVLVLVLTCLAGAAMAAGFDREFTFDSKELKVASMVGAVQVVQAAGDDFRVTARVRGGDADPELLDFLVSEGSRGELVVAFPIEDHRKYVYPVLGDSRTTINYHNENDGGGSWLRQVFRGITGNRITVQGQGNGLEIWADLTIEVPRGRVLEVRQAVGAIAAASLKADLNLDTSSGAIVVRDIEGDFLADTGSGTVEARGMTGDLNIDTGSGSVTVEKADSGRVLVDTGSGGVTLDSVACDALEVDTGSGGVRAGKITVGKANIDTGSGAVFLQLDGMGAGRFLIDTGSGGITLVLPADASAHITAETGSGGIETQVAGATVKVQDRDELDMTVGDGESRVILDAGSGSITIR